MSDDITVSRADLIAVLHGWGIDDPDDESYEAWQRLLAAVGIGDG